MINDQRLVVEIGETAEADKITIFSVFPTSPNLEFNYSII